MALIAKSTFSNGVVLACQSDDGSLSAVKCVDTDACPTSALLLLQHEAALSRKIKHPNIHIYSSVWLSKSKLCMSSPLMEYGSCADIMASHFSHGLPEKVIALILHEILQALMYLHSMGLVHRGVRCSHILVSKNGEIKLSGHRNLIELSRDGVPVRKVHDFPKHDSSILPWLSPEILQQDMQGYCTKSDIYSLGITACELGNGHAPFTDMTCTQMLLEKLNGTVPFLLDQSTVEPLEDHEREDSATVNINNEVTRVSMIKVALSRRFSPIMHKLVCDCLEREPDLRMDAQQLLKHAYFKQLKGQSNLEILQPVFAKLHPIDCSSSDMHEAEALDGLRSLDVEDAEWDFPT